MEKQTKPVLYDQLVLHVPHASTFIPPVYCGRLVPVPGMVLDFTDEIKDKSFYMVDYYTDDLFVPEHNIRRIHSLVFDWNRVLCDVERLPHDPLEDKGCGIFHHRFIKDGGYHDLKHYSSLMRYLEHQTKLASLLVQVALLPWTFQSILLIDCHSFSMHPTDLCPNPPADVDICLGYNEDWSKPSDQIIELVKNYFQKKGYRVALNTPFSNSKTVEAPVYYHSLMIEVNKSLYMNEETLEKTAGFSRLQKDIQEVYSQILLAGA